MFPITKSWYNLLKEEFESEKYTNFSNWLNNEYNTKNIYPKPENVFNALNKVKFDDVKIIIIGQDPYFGKDQAQGMCFSVNKNMPIPPSLHNIFLELKNDIGCYIPNNGDLTKWAEQGILLLNSVLTVEEGKPNSHKGKGWEQITSKVIDLLNNRNKPVIFMLWGNNARVLGKNLNNSRHYILVASHPSPMSANQGGWFGCEHFSKANEILHNFGCDPIDWQIENK